MSVLAALYPLPHARLDTDGETTAPRKQAARMLKCECQVCGYTVRTARKWLETARTHYARSMDMGRCCMSRLTVMKMSRATAKRLRLFTTKRLSGISRLAA